ncbi:MAG TPA: cytochrome c oxidase assembly protein [Longimicrobiales bacterium]
MLAAADPWRWQAHPGVWLLVAGIIALGLYATRVIGPKVVPAGTPVVTRRQRTWFVLAVVLLYVSADWPMHDIGENHLYSVHMVQHMLMAFMVPPLFLMATPQWLARLVVSDAGAASRWIRRLARPVPAAVLFNGLTALLHWEEVVRLSVENGAFHYSMHVLLFGSALLMWVPVVGPLPEMRISLPAQMIYLFLQSVIPTVPGAWLTFANNPVYEVYDRAYRLWGVGVIDDQQAAGAIMKILGGFYLWTIITVLFFKWASRQEALNARSEHERPRVVRDERLDARTTAVVPVAELSDELTFESLQAEWERLGPAPNERAVRSGDDPPAN